LVDLQGARNDNVPAWKVAKAHNAVLRCARAALAAAGYRVKRDNYHYRHIQSLRFTAGCSPDLIDILEAARKKRHAALYDDVAMTSETEATEFVEVAERAYREVLAWLKRAHRELIPRLT